MAENGGEEFARSSISVIVYYCRKRIAGEALPPGIGRSDRRRNACVDLHKRHLSYELLFIIGDGDGGEGRMEGKTVSSPVENKKRSSYTVE